MLSILIQIVVGAKRHQRIAWTKIEQKNIKPNWVINPQPVNFSTLIACHNCIINSLWPSEAIQQQRSGPTLVQVMACYLTPPSHYLNQCWLIISEIQWHSYYGNLQAMPQPSITKICLKITSLKFHSNFPGANDFNIRHSPQHVAWIQSSKILKAYCHVNLPLDRLMAWNF